MISFDNSYARMPERFFAPVLPTPVASPRLIAFNWKLADELGLGVRDAMPERLAEIFSGNVLLPGSETIAMAYAGHQFGQFVPQLGDGRAILLGEVIDTEDRRRDIQLKGAGPTPFSRRGDGRAALGPVLREYIVSEAMHALGIPATRALAAVASGELVRREQMLPGAVLTRVAASHIRVGTFQFFAARGDNEGIRLLADHVIDRHYPEAREAENPYLAMLQGIAKRQARLVARWLHVGFVHGVMNTDNMAISGETIDFGPCAFLDEYNPAKVFSSIDQMGRYAYGKQPGLAQWNLARLAECVLPLLDSDEEKAVQAGNSVLEGFGAYFQDAWLEGMRGKLGLTTTLDSDAVLVQDLLTQMQTSETDFTVTFRRLCEVVEGDAEDFRALFIDLAAIDAWITRWRERLAHEGRDAARMTAFMQGINPAIIPRNHRIEEAIAAAIEDDDFSLFEQMVAAIAKPYEDRPEFSLFELPPQNHERVSRTFCGT